MEEKIKMTKSELIEGLKDLDDDAEAGRKRRRANDKGRG